MHGLTILLCKKTKLLYILYDLLCICMCIKYLKLYISNHQHLKSKFRNFNFKLYSLFYHIFLTT